MPLIINGIKAAMLGQGRDKDRAGATQGQGLFDVDQLGLWCFVCAQVTPRSAREMRTGYGSPEARRKQEGRRPPMGARAPRLRPSKRRQNRAGCGGGIDRFLHLVTTSLWRHFEPQPKETKAEGCDLRVEGSKERSRVSVGAGGNLEQSPALMVWNPRQVLAAPISPFPITSARCVVPETSSRVYNSRNHYGEANLR